MIKDRKYDLVIAGMCLVLLILLTATGTGLILSKIDYKQNLEAARNRLAAKARTAEALSIATARAAESEKSTGHTVKILHTDWVKGVGICEIDRHEYIITSNGGIVHSESCPCKNR